MLYLFIGIFITFASAWVGLVAIPYIQMSRLKPLQTEDGLLPGTPSGLAQYGRRVYAANGCIYCHSQQVRPEHFSSDVARGLGPRQSDARDYMGEKPVFLGTMRTGPDLTNIGKARSDPVWHHQHLYNPQALEPKSNMPPFRFLYEKRKIDGSPSPDALKLKGSDVPEAGYEIVPTYEAKALVAYLLSLDRSYPVPESPANEK
jgi:cytochrome c oxidase cbb3-type subunit 2